MTRCSAGPKKKRGSNTHKGNPSDFKHSVRGCNWVGKGANRVCERCGKKPERLFISRFYSIKEEETDIGGMG